MRRLFALILFAALGGCGTSFTAGRPADYAASIAGDYYGSEASEAASLFSSDSRVLSDSEIARILEHRYAPPRNMRIAVLPFGWSTWAGWSEVLALSTGGVDARLLARLKASDKVYDAAFVPTILLPEKRTVPYLREAAARYQADLLLVFRSACRLFERYRVFQADEGRAYCGVEAVALDVRSGLVPFVARSTQTYSTEKAETDLSFREAILRSQLSAVALGLDEVSAALVQFLDEAAANDGA